ncbi:Disrupted in renal carcinoma protein 2-like [Mizuhopecten yessoensis]|uniref:Disrupted in renal carcinoma protein 2-like n=1 Tax=Mizuhopecten yessoensis TaxID=6573 RepID=A0A210Q4Z9_MIZYE|nr:Disrupted in renal carcinoma protein 2-like [Mizuhopecten yessoensis]
MTMESAHRSYVVTVSTLKNNESPQISLKSHVNYNGYFNNGFCTDKDSLKISKKENGQITNEKSLHDKKCEETHVYKRRWYILFVYCLLTLTQAMLWNTWGPIADSSHEAFGWDDGDTALLTDFGPIAFLLVVFLFSWIVDEKGLRWACVLTAFVMMLGAGLRCITDQPPYVKVTAGIGQFLNGIGTPVSMGVPPVLSAAWFPANQRTISTAIATVANLAGVGLSFVIGPFMVPDEKNSTGYTGHYTFNTTTEANLGNASSFPDETVLKKRNQIMNLLYIECGWAVAIFLLLLVYFPAKPTIPPSISASTERLNFKQGCKKLLRNGVFWVIACSYGLSVGILGAWPGVLEMVLKPHGISENEAGLIGLYSVVCGIFLSLVAAKCSDVFSKSKKLILLGLYVTSGAFALWMNLLLSRLLPDSFVSMHIATVVGGATLTATTPVYFEMACETTYPVAEGITNFVLALVNNLVSVAFLAIQTIPHIGKYIVGRLVSLRYDRLVYTGFNIS